MLFVGLYSVPNLIVIIFNLLYPVFIVRFNCKSCVIERERVCEDSSKWRQKSFRGYLVTKHPVKWCMYLAHDWNAKSQDRWRQLYFASNSQVKLSRETPAKHSILLNCHFWYTLFVPTLFIPTLPTDVKECFWKKTLVTNLES